MELGVTNKNYFYSFADTKERDKVYFELLKNVGFNCVTEKTLENITLKWQSGNMTNFDYLMCLNAASGRTFCDFS